MGFSECYKTVARIVILSECSDIVHIAEQRSSGQIFRLLQNSSKKRNVVRLYGFKVERLSERFHTVKLKYCMMVQLSIVKCRYSFALAGLI